MSSAPVGSLRGWGAGARAAGGVLALGYLLGLVRGPLVAVVGALALMTLGRCAAADDSDDLVLGGSITVVAGALLVAALRWETLDLPRLRGAQAVLGPTVLVGPPGAAAAAWVAALAGTVALSVWLATVRRGDGETSGRLVRGVWLAEAAVGGFAIATAFWGGSVPRGSFGGSEGALALGRWIAAIGVVTGAAAGVSILLDRLGRWRAWVLPGCAAALLGAIVAITTTVP